MLLPVGPVSFIHAIASDIHPPLHEPESGRHDSIYCSDKSRSKLGSALAMFIAASNPPSAPKAQQLPQFC